MFGRPRFNDDQVGLQLSETSSGPLPQSTGSFSPFTGRPGLLRNARRRPADAGRSWIPAFTGHAPAVRAPNARTGGKSGIRAADYVEMAQSPPEPDHALLGSLKSELAGDADMLELVEFFVADLQGKIDAINEAWRAEDLGRLLRVTRQLKEAGGGYGFPSISRAAGELNRDLATEAMELSSLNDKVEALMALCRSARAED